jgi:hypothetical protein
MIRPAPCGVRPVCTDRRSSRLMPDDRKPSPLELGLYARAEAEPRITADRDPGRCDDAGLAPGGRVLRVRANRVREAVAGRFRPIRAGRSGRPAAGRADLGGRGAAARSARTLRQEANRLQASIDAMRIAYVEQQQNSRAHIKPEIMRRFEELVLAQGAATPGQPATFTSLRALAPPETSAAVSRNRPIPTCRSPRSPSHSPSRVNRSRSRISSRR